MSKKQIPDDLIVAALVKHKGLLSQAARSLGVGRATLVNHMKPEHKELCEQQREELLDIAEDNLAKAVISGDQRATEFILKCRGHSRGYTERRGFEVSGSIETKTVKQKQEAIGTLLAKLAAGSPESDGTGKQVHSGNSNH